MAETKSLAHTIDTDSGLAFEVFNEDLWLLCVSVSQNDDSARRDLYKREREKMCYNRICTLQVLVWGGGGGGGGSMCVKVSATIRNCMYTTALQVTG